MSEGARTTVARCALCGAAIPPGAPFGQCPTCLLSLGSQSGMEALDGVELLDPGQVRRFGDYELLEEIARGGMGVVYRARQLSLGREVAVKMILAGELATSESVQRFRNEAAAAARLDHPHIVSVYEIGEHETQHFFSMRLVVGARTIAQWARAPSPPFFRTIARMLAAVARAVAFAHERGVLHRDLKPSNILVDEKGEPHVTDFGLAKLVHESDSGITHSAAMLGSPSYMAPEQADGRHADVTTATDVYGLGAVLYEMLAGRPPFLGASAVATARMVVDSMPAALPEVPEDVATICLKCLAKEPAQRYASARELAEDLERFATGEPIRARPVSTAEALWRWAKRRPKIAALLGALALALVLGFAGVTWQWRRAEHARVEQEKSVEHLHWMDTARQAESPEAPIAIARLAEILRENPARWQAAMLAMSVIDQRAFPMLAGPPVISAQKLTTPPRLAPDGRWWAAGDDRAVQVWDAATGRERTHIALAAPATALAVAQGPLALAVATKDGRVSAFSALEAPAQPLQRAGSEPIEDLRFSADGSHLLGRSKDRVEVWRADAPIAPRTFTLDGGFSDAAISSDGARMFGWNAKRAAVWDAAWGERVLEVTADAEFKRGALAASGRRFALIDGMYFVRTWDVEARAPLPTLESPLALVHLVALNAAGTRVTIGGDANDLTVFDTTSGLRVATAVQHLYSPVALRTSPDGTRTLSFGRDGRACVWDADSGRLLLGPIWLDTENSNAVDLSHDGRRVLLFPKSGRGESDAVSVWRSTQTRPPQRHAIEGQRDFNHARMSPDGKLGCIGLWDSPRAHVYELATGRVVLDAPANGHIYVHLFSPDMRRYYALTANGWLHGWSLDTGAPLWPPGRQPGLIRPGAISADGARIIAGHSDGHIRIYDTATGQLVQTLDHSGEVKTLRFAPDGSGRFVSGSTDGVAHLWDLRSGEKLRTFTGHTQPILASAWSPDSRYIATASYDQTARVWDAATGRAVSPPMPHLAWLAHLEFSPEGRLLATACRDGTARLWHPLTGEPASGPLPQGDTVATVRFTRDGSCLLVRDHSGFRFWDTARAEPVTARYWAPMSSGIGMDGESIHAMLSADATRVFLGYSMNAAELWNIPQPRTPVPAWFPDLLEGLAHIRIEHGTARVFSGEKMPALEAKITASKSSDPFTLWAQEILAEKVP
ncbi:MAG: WD40 repeat domain-containing serine/threonine protein kinase [Chthoniobacteraceae bacterium]